MGRRLRNEQALSIKYAAGAQYRDRAVMAGPAGQATHQFADRKRYAFDSIFVAQDYSLV
jgi:hypothetical protein